jgi:hypothetical protein
MTNELIIKDEEILLLGLCRLEFNEEHIKKIRILIEQVRDWNYFGTLARIHGVAALAGHNLEKHGLLKGIPQEIIDNLRGALLMSLSRNAFNSETMAEVLRLLNPQDIKIVLLKGLADRKSVV